MKRLVLALLSLNLFSAQAFAYANPAPIIQAEFEKSVLNQTKSLEDNGFQKWDWISSQTHPCLNCELTFVAKHVELETEAVKGFIQALETEKPTIMKLYGVSSNDYNFLAHMAVGILGRESGFFESKRYKFKEAAPGIIRVLKVFRNSWKGAPDDPSPNSRGPTQIKIVPDLIANHYDITVDDLWVPRNAAVSTVGYLVKAFQEFKRRVNRGEYTGINVTNYVDYLPYIYFGARHALADHTATPAKSVYVQDMKRYMSWVDVYERPADMKYYIAPR